MKVIKPVKVPVLTRVAELGRRPFFHVACTVAFPLADPRKLIDELSFWKTTGAELGESGIFDEGFTKARGELLVCGRFSAPDGQPVAASYARVRVGSVDKRVAVVGDRFWRGGGPTAPVPITTMPIDWAHAFGGPKHEQNPYGKGAEPIEIDGQERHPLPNIERYGALVRSPSERPEPAGFMPMDLTFAARRARAGSYDKRWLEEHFPGLPPDADASFYNVAAVDQWLAEKAFFRGDEDFLVENMNADRPRLEGKLPGLVARSFVTHRTPDGDRFLEIPLRCDTVWLFPTAGMGAVIFHGSMRVAEDDGADIVHLVCACEEPSAPRPIDHYQAVLARRLDKDKGAFASISDGDLMPPRASGVPANIADIDVGRWVKSENLTAANVRRGKERDFAEARARLEAEGLDPKEHGLAELPPEPAAPPGLEDLDALAAFAEAELQKAEDARGSMEAEGKALEEQARKLHAEHGQDYDKTMADAAKSDVGPPKWSAAAHLATMRQMAEDARADGVPTPELDQRLADPAYEAQLRSQEADLHRMYRRFGHTQLAAPRLDADGSERARHVIGLAIESGDSLAGCDLTGASLSGMRLAKLDFARAYLESTALDGCDLSGACFEGAVLAKADLRGADLRGAKLGNANLGGADLRGADLAKADLTGAILSRAELEGARFDGADLSDVDLIEAKLAGIDLSGAKLRQATIIKADLRGARFIAADLGETLFVECDLSGVDLSRATLTKVSFVGCRGEGAIFREARFRQGVIVHGSSFPRADFSDADMEMANLRGTSIVGARFDGATLVTADLSDCDATGASFERAVMKGAMLIRTRLADASLAGANLLDALASKSHLAGARFTGANLYRADLSRVIGDARTSFAEAEVGLVRFLPKAEVPARGAS